MSDESQLHEQLTRYVGGDCTDVEIRELSVRLERDPAACDLLAETLLHGGAIRDFSRAHPAPQVISMPKPRRFLWRPLVAAAAGIVFGVFCTSVGFGLGFRGIREDVKRLFPLKNGGFEDGVGTLAPNPPASFGLWTGDASEVVVGNPEAQPKSGKRMLRFVRGEDGPPGSSEIVNHRNVYQLIDLRPIWIQVGKDDEVTLELSVSFLKASSLKASSSPSENGGFQCRLLINPGSPEMVRDGWPDTKMGGCAYARTDLENGSDTLGQWRTVRAKVLLPRNAQVAAVHLSAFETVQSASSDGALAHSYADDVTLTVSSRSANPNN